jgi:hypothetical protein
MGDNSSVLEVKYNTTTWVYGFLNTTLNNISVTCISWRPVLLVVKMEYPEKTKDVL